MKSDHGVVTNVIPKVSVILILSVHFFSLLPHMSHIPIWVFIFSFACLMYRSLVFFNRLPFLTRPIHILLIIFVVIGIYLEYRTELGVQVGVTLLILSFSMKLLEMRCRRDAYIQIILGYFVIATEFLFETHWMMTLYLFSVMVLITAALVGLNQKTRLNQDAIYADMKSALAAAVNLSWQAIPIMIFLFVFFPRLDPFWLIDFGKDQQKVGLNESMAPGEFNQLGGMNQLAFRAEFIGRTPPHPLLYWRGLVFSDFDGSLWSIHEWDKQHSQLALERYEESIQVRGIPIQYRVLMEPSGQPYLFTLDMPRVPTQQSVMTRGFSLLHNNPIHQPYGYSVESYFDFSAQSTLSRREKYIDLKLPKNSNLKTHKLAKAWIQEVKGDTDAYVKKVLDWFREDSFVYTLSPQQYGQNTVDDFLFETKEGYCAYYASAFVVLMRAAGIPARVVAGYMGGEVNPLGNYVLVRQYEAHAWAEIWQPKIGWRRVDPTMAVAPERILDSIEDLLAKEEKTQDSRLLVASYQANPVFQKMRHAFDYASFRWRKVVVGFDRDAQKNLFENIFPDISTTVISLIVMSFFTAIIAIYILLFSKFQVKRKIRPIDTAFESFCRILYHKKLIRMPGESPASFCNRAAGLYPQQVAQFEAIAGLYKRQYQAQFAWTLTEERRVAKKIKQMSKALSKRL